jgi:hypothetical protein
MAGLRVPDRGRLPDDPPGETLHTVVITSNYGEAGAIAQDGPALGLPQPSSGHNQLYFTRRPPTRPPPLSSWAASSRRW